MMNKNFRIIIFTINILCLFSCGGIEAKNLSGYLKKCDLRNDMSASIEFFQTDDIKALKKELRQIDNIDFIAKNGVNLLLCSMYYDNRPAFKYLLTQKADPNITFSNGKSILHYASLINDVYYLETLLEFGAKVDKIDMKKMWNPTPLFYVVTKGNVGGIRVLLNKKANIDFRNSMEQTPLLAAALVRDYKTTYFLLSQGANYKIKDNVGSDLKMYLEQMIIPRDVPLFEDKFKVISFLKEKGIDVKY